MSNAIWFILTMILVLAAVGILAASRKATYQPEDDYGRPKGEPVSLGGAFRATAAVLLAFAILFLIMQSTVVVGAREVGVITNFATYDGTAGSGWHLVKPWSGIERFDTRIQRDSVTVDQVQLAGETTKDEAGQTIKIPGAVADQVKLTIRWHIGNAGDGGASPELSATKAKNLWAKYRNFTAVSDQLVTPEIKTSTNEVLGGINAADAKDGTQRRTLGKKVQENLQGVVGDDGVAVDSVSITDLDLNKDAQDRLNQAVAAQGKLATDRVEQERAKVQAETNKLRQVNSTPTSLIQQCFDLVRFYGEQHRDLPPTFDCKMFVSAGGDITKTLPLK